MPDALDRIRATIAAHDVVLFMKGVPEAPQCGFSSAVVRILDHLGAPFAGVNVLADEDIRQGVKDYANWPTIPQLYVKANLSAAAISWRCSRRANSKRCSRKTACSPLNRAGVPATSRSSRLTAPSRSTSSDTRRPMRSRVKSLCTPSTEGVAAPSSVSTTSPKRRPAPSAGPAGADPSHQHAAFAFEIEPAHQRARQRLGLPRDAEPAARHAPSRISSGMMRLAVLIGTAKHSPAPRR